MNIRFMNYLKNIMYLPGILIFIFTLIIVFSTPYYWAYNYTLFDVPVINYMAFLIIILTGIIYMTIANRVLNFNKYIGDLSKLVLILIESILLFAAVYLWLILFLKDISFHGVCDYKYLWCVTKPEYVCSTYFKTLLDTVISCVHFSIVTAATVGYGDVYPTHWVTKLVVDFQIIYTFTIVIIGIGKFGGNNNRGQEEILAKTKAARATKKTVAFEVKAPVPTVRAKVDVPAAKTKVAVPTKTPNVSRPAK